MVATCIKVVADRDPNPNSNPKPNPNPNPNPIGHWENYSHNTTKLFQQVQM